MCTLGSTCNLSIDINIYRKKDENSNELKKVNGGMEVILYTNTVQLLPETVLGRGGGVFWKLY